MPQAESKHSEAEVIEAAQDQIEHLIGRRADQAEQQRLETEWQQSVKVVKDRERRERQREWIEWHRNRAHSLQQWVNERVDFHRRRAQELSDSLPEEGA